MIKRIYTIEKGILNIRFKFYIIEKGGIKMKVIRIEYYTKDKMLNFELFNNINKAYQFYKNVDVCGVQIVNVNNKHIYFEDDKTLNYEDVAGLFKE